MADTRAGVEGTETSCPLKGLDVIQLAQNVLAVQYNCHGLAECYLELILSYLWKALLQLVFPAQLQKTLYLPITNSCCAKQYFLQMAFVVLSVIKIATLAFSGIRYWSVTSRVLDPFFVIFSLHDCAYAMIYSA